MLCPVCVFGEAVHKLCWGGGFSIWGEDVLGTGVKTSPTSRRALDWGDVTSSSELTSQASVVWDVELGVSFPSA